MGMERIVSLGIKVTPITDTIFLIHGNNRSRSPFSNAIYIKDEYCILMDTGCGLDIIGHLKNEVDIDLVVLSHSHPDHTGGTWLLQQESGPDVSVPSEGADSIISADRLAVRFVPEDLAQLWKDTYLSLTGFRDFTYTSLYGDSSEFRTGENRFVALHTPGHLMDHYCLWEPDRKILIGFDIDMSPFGPWYGNPESDIGLFKKSIDHIRNLPAEVYISSHARPMKSQHFIKRLSAYEAVFSQRDAVLLEIIPAHSWISIEEILMESPIYQVDYAIHHDKILKFGETSMIEKHLRHLKASGLIEEDGNGLYRKLS